MKASFFYLVSFALLCTTFTLCGCSSTQLKVNLSSTANLNMNGAHEPLPVVVRIYQLADAKSFETATFNELWKTDLTVLGNSLLRKDTLTVDPASQQKVRFDRHEQAKFVGVMAAFRNQQNNSWRIIQKTSGSFLGMSRSTSLTVLLKDNVIELAN